MQRDIGKPLFDLALLVAAAAAFAFATTLPEVRVPGDISPAFFPKMLSALIFLCAIPCLIKDLREWRDAGPTNDTEVSVGGRLAIGQWVFVVALTIAYILAFERLGYIVSTALFAAFCVLGMLLLSGVWRQLSALARFRSLGGTAVFAIVLAVSIYFVFTEVFRIPLPS